MSGKQSINRKLLSTTQTGAQNNAGKLEPQQQQDAQSSEISAGLLAQRAKSKSASFYSNANRDLVDTLKQAKLDEAERVEIDINKVVGQIVNYPQRG